MDSIDQTDDRLVMLKRATRVLIKACGKLEAAAEITGKSHEQMRRYGDPLCPETMPVFMIAQLEAECGEPYVTRQLAGMSRHSLRPEGARDVGPDLRTAYAMARVATATFDHTVAVAKADGVITPNEHKAISDRGAEAQAAINDVVRMSIGASTPAATLRAVEKAGDA